MKWRGSTIIVTIVPCPQTNSCPFCKHPPLLLILFMYHINLLTGNALYFCTILLFQALFQSVNSCVLFQAGVRAVVGVTEFKTEFTGMLKLHERCVKNVLCAMNCEWILTIEFTGISIQKVRLSKAIIQSNSDHIDSANLK